MVIYDFMLTTVWDKYDSRLFLTRSYTKLCMISMVPYHGQGMLSMGEKLWDLRLRFQVIFDTTVSQNVPMYLSRIYKDAFSWMFKFQNAANNAGTKT